MAGFRVVGHEQAAVHPLVVAFKAEDWIVYGNLLFTFLEEGQQFPDVHFLEEFLLYVLVNDVVGNFRQELAGFEGMLPFFHIRENAPHEDKAVAG